MSATTTAAPRSISCPPVRSRSCRSPASASSIVWTETKSEAERIVALPDAEFHAELEKRFGLHLGDIAVAGPRRAFPLGLFTARSFIAERVALIGDAAHIIHPIAGQGLNMGLRDAAALAEVIADAARLGLDPGARRRARALSALAALRHHDDGRRHRRPQPVVLQFVRCAAACCATSALAWSSACRRSSASSSAKPPALPATCRSS